MRHAHCRRSSGWDCLGFSLVELLLVVALLVLLTTLYWSPRSGSRERALHAACQRNLQKLGLGFQIYANENGGRFPIVQNASRSEQPLEKLVPQYTSDHSLFICVASQDSAPAPGVSLTNSRISYAYYMGRSSTNASDALLSDAQVNTNSKDAGELIFSADGKPPGNNHGKNGGNLLFGDGHVQGSPAKAAAALPVRDGETLLNPRSP